MTRKLFKRFTTMLVAMSLVVGVMTGFVFTKPVEAQAAETVHVYYKFKSLKTRAEFDDRVDQEVIFIPASLGIDFDTQPCLPGIPKGSARQIVADYSTGHTASTAPVEEGTSAKGAKASTITASFSRPPENSTVIAKVVTIVAGTGFDSCPAGGYAIGDGSSTTGYKNDLKYIYYGCNGGGVRDRNCAGNVVEYEEADIPLTDVSAMIKPQTVIDQTGNPTTVTKTDIQLSFIKDGQNYMVPETLDDADYKVSPSNNSVNPKNGDDNIDVIFQSKTINVKCHIHEWEFSQTEDGSGLTAKCVADGGDNCPVQEVPQISLDMYKGQNGNKPNVNDTTPEGDPISAVEYDMNTAWNYVSGGKPVITYKSLDVDGVSTNTSPKRPGNYRATMVAKGSDGVDYEVAKEFAVDKDGYIIEVEGHIHQWKYSLGPDGTLTCECIAKLGTCPLTSTYQITADVTGGEHGTGEDYTGTGITQMGKGEITDEEAIANLEMPEPSMVEYIIYETELDPDGNPLTDEDGNIVYKTNPSTGKPIEKTRTFTRPEGSGAYTIVQTYENPDGSTVEVSTDFTIFTGKDKYGNPLVGSFSVDVPYRYRYPGTGIDYSNGRVWYTTAQKNAANDADKATFDKASEFNPVGIDDDRAARTALINKPVSNDGSAVSEDLYIDMFTEHLNLPAGKKVASYCLTKGGRWVDGELTDELLTRAFDKGETQIAVSFEKLNDKGKPAGTYYTFVKAEKRPACTALKVNYAVCSDKTGRTPGQFILTDSDGKALYNCGGKYDVTFAMAGDDKKISSAGWGVWPATGGVWVPEMITDNKGKLKAGKVVMYVRTSAKINSTGSKFTPASKMKKLSIATSQKPASVKADYKKEVMKLKKGVVAYFGTEIIDITKSDFYAFTKDYGTEIYAVTPAAVSGSAAETINVTFETLANKYPEELSFDDYEDMIVDYDEDISTNQDLKSKGINISGYLTGDRNTVLVWTKANDKKPASTTAEIKLAKRRAIDSSVESLVTIDDKGKAIIAKLGPDNQKFSLEIKITDKKGKVSWKTSIPMVAKTDLVTAAGIDYQIAESIYEIRVKCDAKGGKEDDNTSASGISRFVLVTYKNIGTGRSIKVGVEKVEFFDTEDLAKAAKKIAEPAPEPEPEPTT